MKRLHRFIWIYIGIGFIFDQLTKYCAREFLAFDSISFGLIRLDLVYNKGAAYGIFSDYTFVLLMIGVAVIGYLIYSLDSLIYDRLTFVAYSFLISGGLGNTFDRLIFGQVTDFINIEIIPVFNFANVFLNIGLGSLIIHYFLYGRKQESS